MWVREALWSGTERPAPPSVYGLPKPAWSTPVSCRTPSPDWEVKQQTKEPQCSCWTLPSLLHLRCPLWFLYGWQQGNRFNIPQRNKKWSFMYNCKAFAQGQKQCWSYIVVACSTMDLASKKQLNNKSERNIWHKWEPFFRASGQMTRLWNNCRVKHCSITLYVPNTCSLHHVFFICAGVVLTHWYNEYYSAYRKY